MQAKAESGFEDLQLRLEGLARGLRDLRGVQEPIIASRVLECRHQWLVADQDRHHFPQNRCLLLVPDGTPDGRNRDMKLSQPRSKLRGGGSLERRLC